MFRNLDSSSMVATRMPPLQTLHSAGRVKPLSEPFIDSGLRVEFCLAGQSGCSPPLFNSFLGERVRLCLFAFQSVFGIVVQILKFRPPDSGFQSSLHDSSNVVFYVIF